MFKFKSKSKKNKLAEKIAAQDLIIAEQKHQQNVNSTGKKGSIQRQNSAPQNGTNTAAPSIPGKTLCQVCKKKCSGEVLRVQQKYFHMQCFKCTICRNSLAQGGFFTHDDQYYCAADYQRNYGTKCHVCNDYVEGEVITALGKTYHQKCFKCDRCHQVFPNGDKVVYNGKEVLCQKCTHVPTKATATQLQNAAATKQDSKQQQQQHMPKSPSGSNNPNECAGCGDELKEGQALIALERQWHVWCFKCGRCGAVLHGEYMGRDGVPYCERDYQRHFGVKCAYCDRYISGKVLQAGENHHFHPTCARCTKCGDPFGDGEEMYLQGGAIWHPRCGPGPTENGQLLNGPATGVAATAVAAKNGTADCTDAVTGERTRGDYDRMSSSGVSDMQHFSYRTPSPGLVLRDYNKSATMMDDISRIYTYSYLTEEPSLGYLRKPIDPYDKAPVSPHFHRPHSQNSVRGSQTGGSQKFVRQGSKSGMKVLVDSIRSETPRPKSPHMNNEEPIELAHFPGGKPPHPDEMPKIERDDFPAPPYPYTDPERRKRWSDTYKGVSEDEDDIDGELKSPKEVEDERLKREETELSKIATGIGKVFLKNVKEREKIKQWKAANLDPRNASRTPSAKKEPTYRLRYESPIGASPSRNLDHPKPFEDDEFDRSISCRSSMGRSTGQIPSYNVVSSLRNVPRPGYGFKSSTLPIGNGYGDYSFSGMGVKTHSTDFSSGKSDISTGSITDVERRALNAEMPVSSTYTGGLGLGVGRGGYGAAHTAVRGHGGGGAMPPTGVAYTSQVRRSLPNMAHSMLVNEPAKIYPYHLLVITNYRLPGDVDRCNLERHLSDAEFEALFQCPRADFYRLPSWRKNELKRRFRLF